MTFYFPELGSLAAVLLSGRVPEQVTMQPCRHGRAGGGVWVHTDVDVGDVLPFERWEPQQGGTDASCWAEVLPTRPAPMPEVLDEVLFVVPADQLVGLAGELLRLGCDRQHWAMHDDQALLRAHAPPWYTVLHHAERGTAFLRAGPGAWIAFGRSHPLLPQPDQGMLIVPALGRWRTVPDGPWTDMYTHVDLTLGGDVHTHTGADLPRLEIPLRLVPGSHADQPALWVLHSPAIAQLEAMLERVPEQVLEGLRFAATAEEPPTILLLAPNARTAPELGLRADGFAPLLGLPNAFRPVHSTIEPPIRQDAMRTLLAAQPYEITWLTASDTGIDVHRIHQDAFRPLKRWVDYIVSRHAQALTPWVQDATFEFPSWADIGGEWAQQRRERPRRTADEDERTTPRAPEAPAPPKKRPTAPSTRTTRVVRPRPVDTGPADELIRRLTELEIRFRDLEGGPEASERVPLWTDIALTSRALGRHTNARLAWAQAAWHSQDPQVAAAWAADELGQLGLEQSDLRIEPKNTWALAALLLSGALEPTPELASFFDEAAVDLDVRTAFSTLATLAAGDALGLERARDLVLERLRRGLVSGVDIPPFLGRVDAGTRETLHRHLENQHRHFHETKRDRTVLEAPEHLTMAYVDLVFAWGFANLGSTDRAEALRQVDLDETDPVHGPLVAAYQARITQALQNMPREAPLPPEVRGQLDELKGLLKYKVDRLRSASGILEPRERLDPFRSFTLDGATSGSELRGLEGRALEDALEDMLVRRADAEGLHQWLLALTALRGPAAVDLLTRLSLDHIEPADRIMLHADALVAAGMLGQRTLAQSHSEGLQQAIGQADPDALARATLPLVRAFRGLRRLGLQDLANASLDRILEVADGGRLAHQLARTAAAGGLALGGAVDRALPLLASAVDTCNQPFDRPVDQQQMVRTTALALAGAPRDFALEQLPRLAAILDGISDSFNTNSHFCFSVIDFAESIVLGYSDRQLLQDPEARRYVLDDEYLLRQRIRSV